jgi:hypothetical protein
MPPKRMIPSGDTMACVKCTEVKPVIIFRRHLCGTTGYSTICRDCRKAEQRARDRRRNRTEAYRESNRLLHKKYRDEGRPRECDRKNSAISRQRFPKHHRARAIVCAAIKSGRLVRPDACGTCGLVPDKLRGGRAPIQAHHHNGYDDPLDVVWVCIPCHHKEHRRGDT